MLAQHCLTEQVKGPDKRGPVYSSKIPARKLVKRVKSTAKMEWGSRQELDPQEEKEAQV